MRDLELIYQKMLQWVSREGDCLVWTGGLGWNGYGVMMWKLKNYRPHRIALARHTGKMEKKLHALHRCGNRRCVKPAHLYWGTAQQNMVDRSVDGNHRLQIFSVEDVKRIRKEYVRGDGTHQFLATKYGVSKSAISHMMNGRNWKHVK